MSKVTQITVLYGRKIQPKKYEEKHGLLEATVVADEGGEVSQTELIAVFENLISRVHVALGLEEDAPPVANSVDEPGKKTTKTRTRRTKKQIADDKAKAEAEKPADEVPVEGDEDGVVDNSGKEVPEDAESVEESVETDEGVSDTDLQGAAARAAAAHGTATVKGLMKEFNIARLSELDQDQRLEFLSKLDDLGN